MLLTIRRNLQFKPSMNPCLFIFFALFLVSETTIAGETAPFPKLGDASGGDCALNLLVYDKVFKTRPSIRALSKATAIINEMCNLGSYIRIEADGEPQSLDFVWSNHVEIEPGSRSLYANDKFSVFLEIGHRLYSIRDRETECVESAYFVRSTFTYAGHQKTIKGTMTGGCP